MISEIVVKSVKKDKFESKVEEIKNKIRVELDLSVDKKIYISLNSLIPDKNTGLIIELFKSWDYLKDSMLIILGDGYEYNELKKSIKNICLKLARIM